MSSSYLTCNGRPPLVICSLLCKTWAQDMLPYRVVNTDPVSWASPEPFFPPSLMACLVSPVSTIAHQMLMQEWREWREAHKAKNNASYPASWACLISALKAFLSKQYEVTSCTQILFLSKQVPTLVAGRRRDNRSSWKLYTSKVI